jgi:tRNA(Ile)-lysidine synthase
MVLAHIFASSGVTPTIAHFNHHLRPDSDLDEALVANFARQNNLELIVGHGELKTASEEAARHARHDFLEGEALHSVKALGGELTRRVKRGSPPAVASEQNSKASLPKVATGHHLDDLVESIAINLKRGTGWRGLAVLNRPNYLRPLLELEKSELQSLARQQGIKWREDSTNQSPQYLRNRLRVRTTKLPFDTKWQLLKLRNRQLEIAREIDEIVQPTNQRQLYQSLDNGAAHELLRAWLRENHIRATRPELSRLLAAIREYRPQKKLQLSRNQFILIRKNDFTVVPAPAPAPANSRRACR